MWTVLSTRHTAFIIKSVIRLLLGITIAVNQFVITPPIQVLAKPSVSAASLENQTAPRPDALTAKAIVVAFPEIVANRIPLAKPAQSTTQSQVSGVMLSWRSDDVPVRALDAINPPNGWEKVDFNDSESPWENAVQSPCQASYVWYDWSHPQRWIWSSNCADPTQTVYFRKTFDLPDAVAYTGTLELSVDNQADIYVNGTYVGSFGDYQSTRSFNSLPLHAGKNVLAVRAYDSGAQSGLWFNLTVQTGASKISDRSTASLFGFKNTQSNPRENALTSGMKCTQGGCGDPINTRTGGFDYDLEDLTMPTLSGVLAFQRTYATAVTNTYTTTLGYGWTHNHDNRLIFEGDMVWFKAQSANQYRFDKTSSGAYASASGVLASLSLSGTTYVLTDSVQSVYTFDANGLVQAWQDAQKHSWNYVYSGTQLTRVFDVVSGRGITLTYDAQDRISQVSDHAGRNVQYGYDANGDLITVTDILSQTWNYIYDTGHLLKEVHAPGRSTPELHVVYDAQGRATQQYDAQENKIIDVAYLTNTTVFTDARLIVMTHTYDARSTLIGTEAPLNSNSTKTYDANFRPATVTDANDHTAQMQWSADGATLLGTMDALSNTIQLGYDSLNNLTQAVDARGFTSSMTYSGTLLTVMTDTLSHTTRYTYTDIADVPQPVGLLKAQQDSSGNVTQYLYDALGQQIAVTDVTGLVTRYEYDNLGRLVTTTTAAGTAQTLVNVNRYDKAGRLLTTIRNYHTTTVNATLDNLTTEYAYDALGNQILMTDTMTRVTKTEYDALNRPVTTTTNYKNGHYDANKPDEDLMSVTGYDAHGNVLTRTEFYDTGMERISLTRYDALNRVISTTSNYSPTATPFYGDDVNITMLTGYDPTGNVLSTTQFYGRAEVRTTLTEYDKLNRPLTVTTNYSLGATSTEYNIKGVTGYDQNGNVVTQTQFYGTTQERTTFTEYDALNRPVTTTIRYALDTTIITNVTGYGSNGQVVTQTQFYGTPQQRVTVAGYDKFNRPLTTTTNYSTVTGNDTNWVSLIGYDARGNVVTQTAFAHTANPRLTVTQYDIFNRPVTVTANYQDGVANASQPDVDVPQVTVYNRAGQRQAAAILRFGNGVITEWVTTTYGYDAVGRVVTTTTPLTTGISAQAITAYDGRGRVITNTDALSHATVTTYDGLDRPQKIVASANTTTPVTMTMTYDAAGNRLTVRDANDYVTQFEYDVLNRLITVTEHAMGGVQPASDVNARTVYTYDVASNRVALQDARGYVSRFGYDVQGHVISESDALTHTQHYAYDIASERISQTDALTQTTLFSYTALGQVKVIDYPSGTPDVAFAYDAFGQQTTMTDGVGVTTWAYDLMGRPLTITDPFTGAVGYAYDSLGNRLKLRYPDSKTVTYTYDVAGRLVQVTDWATHTTRYQYNALGQPLTVTLPNNVATYYEYDSAQRLTNITHYHLTLNQLWASYTYQLDAVGNRRIVTEIVQAPTSLIFFPLIASNGSTSTMMMAPINLLATTTILTDTTASNNGNGTPVVPQATPIPQGYPNNNGNGNDGTHNNNGNGNTPNSTPTLLAPQDTSSLSAYPMPDDTNPSGTTPNGWNNPNNPHSDNLGGGTVTLMSIPAPNPMPAGMTQTVITYTYDGMYRLIEADYPSGGNYTYTYDAVGNRLAQTALTVTTAYTYDHANRLTYVNFTAQTWDNNGNLLSDGVSTYGYDAANRLISVTQGATTTTFAYNGLGNRVKQVISGTVTTYTLDLNTSLVQVLSDGKNAYVYGIGRISQGTVSATAYFLGDALGSVRQLAREDGRITLAKNYEPFGTVKSSIGNAGSVYGFTGEMQENTGLVFLRARYYASGIGRFLTRDSWGGNAQHPMSYNKWGYVENNPINHIDPSGHCIIGIDCPITLPLIILGVVFITILTGCSAPPTPTSLPTVVPSATPDFPWLTFKGDWNVEEKTTAYSAINMVKSFLGPKFSSGIGIADGLLIERLGNTDGSGQAYAWETPNRISAEFNTSSWLKLLIVHELGHFIEYHSAQTTGEPSYAIKVDQGGIPVSENHWVGEWVRQANTQVWFFTGNPKDLPSTIYPAILPTENGSWAAVCLGGCPSEDFAQTFTWMVFANENKTSELINSPHKFQDPSSKRKNAVNDAISRLP